MSFRRAEDRPSSQQARDSQQVGRRERAGRGRVHLGRERSRLGLVGQERRCLGEGRGQGAGREQASEGELNTGVSLARATDRAFASSPTRAAASDQQDDFGLARYISIDGANR